MSQNSMSGDSVVTPVSSDRASTDAPVSVRVESMVYPAYPIGAPDLNPPVSRRWGYWHIYPYTMQDEITAEKKDTSYKTLVLENENLRITVLPELGGHLFAYDKLREREIFYRPSAIKPALIALRGAWIAGGIEFNFPVSHNPLTSSPVDHTIRENRDGSATIYIGAVEKLSRMRWSVGITLRPGAARIETDIRLENCTLMPHRHYFWSNSALRVTEGTRFISPVEKVHGWQGIMNYPWHEGEYVPAYANHKVACDLFSKDVQADFFGCYADDTEEGIVIVADRHQINGRKYFTWGNSDDGLYWQHILAEDGDGPYIEIQSGPYETQSIFRMLEPHHTTRWQETWFGVAGTGGFEYANDDIALNLIRDEAGTKVVLYPTRRLVDVTVSFVADGLDCQPWEGDLDAGVPVSIDIDNCPSDGTVQVTVSAKHNGLIAEAELPWRNDTARGIAMQEPPAPLTENEKDTASGLCAEGYALEEQHQPVQARERYEKALEADPLSVLALKRLGILDLKANLNADAAERFRTAMRMFPEDGETLFYLGLALRRMNERREAAAMLWRARMHPHFGALGRYVLGEMAGEDGAYADALAHFRAAAAQEAPGGKARWGVVVMLRLLDRTEEAMNEARTVLEHDPLNPFIAWEMKLLGHDTPRNLCRDEMQTWLEVAVAYAALGALETAYAILDEAHEVGSSAMLHYFRAWFLKRMGRRQEARDEYMNAAAESSEYVFPHRLEAEAVLREAMQEEPQDANAPYYLGTMLFMLGRSDEGRDLWRKAADMNCHDAALYYCLGWSAWKLDGDLYEATHQYRRALALRPEDHRMRIDFDAIRKERGVSAAERLDALELLPPEVLSKGRIPALLVQLYTETGVFDEAITLLTENTFHPWEGEVGMRKVYTGTYVKYGEHLQEEGDVQGAYEAFAKALEYPLNIGVGKPLRSADAAICYRAGCLAEALGMSDKAQEHWQTGAAEEHHALTTELRYYAEKCRMKTGDTAHATENLRAMLDALAQQESPDEDLMARIETALG